MSCHKTRAIFFLIQIFFQSFKERFRVILDWADSCTVEVRKMQMLDVSERALLQQAHRASMLLNEWLIEGVTSLQPALMVSNLRKRKLIQEC